MVNIRKLSENDVEDFVSIATNAYCGFGVSEEDVNERREFFNIVVNYMPNSDLYGVFKNDKMIGGMRLIDYKMSFSSALMEVGGVGSVAVHLLHKKEKAARELIAFACNHFKDKGIPIVALYPFRTDFYKNMGFGYGSLIRQYKISPSYFVNSGNKSNIDFLVKSDRGQIEACYNRVLKASHGMFEKTEQEFYWMFQDERRTIGFRKDGKISGYINLSYNARYKLKCDLVIHEFIYETKEALLELCTFLNSQSDQFERIVISTQDENFHFMVKNPANGENDTFSAMHEEIGISAQGLMYRVLDVKRLFEVLKNHNFNNQSLKVKITLDDNFVESNNGSTIVSFKDGIASLGEMGHDVEIKLGISEFSSMVMGAVSFKTILKMGLAAISDNSYAGRINSLFEVETKPMCNTYF